jgi:hypothetical protein
MNYEDEYNSDYINKLNNRRKDKNRARQTKHRNKKINSS